MLKVKTLACCAAIALGVPVIASNTATADEILTYTGKDFTTVFTGFTKSDNITGTITLQSALAPGFSGNLNPEAFTFTSGPATISNASPGLTPYTLFVSLDGTGAITRWIVYLTDTDWDIDTVDNGGDESDGVINNITSHAGGINSSAPGTWKAELSVPEPETTALLGCGLLELILAASYAGRRRKPGTAARR